MVLETVRLPYQGPFDWAGALAFFARRAIDGVEHVERGVYERNVRSDDLCGTIQVAHDGEGSALVLTVRGLPAAGTVLQRIRRMFDLDADLPAITAHLMRDPSVAPLVAARPGVRVFGGWDGFEVALRSVIGQQVTVASARRLNGMLVARCGSEMAERADGRHRLFPTAEQVIDADLSDMGMPGARVTTLKTIADAVLREPQLFDPAPTVEETVARLRAIRGIGEWTAHYIAMRACREPDAFPASDIGLLRAAAGAAGRRPTPAQLLTRAEAWRPWRAYAAHYLWASDPGMIWQRALGEPT